MRGTKGSVSSMKEVSKGRTSERVTTGKAVKASGRTSSQKSIGQAVKSTARKGGTSK